MRDIQRVLERWGSWASQEGSHIEWSPVACGFKGILSHEKKPRPCCCDSDGLIVDAAVGMLKKNDRNEELKFIMFHYLYNVSKSTISRWEKCSEGKVRNKLMIAETFIDACIIMSGSRLEMDEYTQKTEINPTLK